MLTKCGKVLYNISVQRLTTRGETVLERKKQPIKVNIVFKPSKKLSCEQSAFLTFPYDEKLLAIIRSDTNRFWHTDTKEWEIPASKVDALLPQLYQYNVVIEGQYRRPVPLEQVELPKGFEFKTKPYEHQVEGFKYGLSHDKWLLGDEMGLGKSKQAIDIAVAKKLTNNYKHCLIICGVNGLKWNWQKEVGTHSNEQCWILGQRQRRTRTVVGGNKQKVEDLENIDNLPYFLITNVESLRDPQVLALIKSYCDNDIIGMCIVDEIHRCKNPASQQGKALLKVLPQTRIAMTGTPLMNTPIDLYIILKWLGYEKHNLFQFKTHYCVMGGYGGYEIVGYKNLRMLQESLNNIMLRRLKKDVLDLPDKIYSTEYVEMSKAQMSIYNEVLDVIRLNIDKIKISANPLAQLIRLRQATAYTGILSNKIQESAKFDRLEEIVQDLVDDNQKCIIFSNWTEVTTPAYERLKRFNPALITGDTKDKDRALEEEKFMKDPNCKCAIGTIGVMGTGLTLTEATTVIFLDSPWTKSAKEQAVDRAHRIGTKTTVNIITLVCAGTMDERVEDIVESKGEMANMLVDGQVQAASQLIDYLLS